MSASQHLHTACKYLCRLCGKYVPVAEIVDLQLHMNDPDRASTILECLRHVETENHVRLYLNLLPPLSDDILRSYARFCSPCVVRAEQYFLSSGYGAADPQWSSDMNKGFSVSVVPGPDYDQNYAPAALLSQSVVLEGGSDDKGEDSFIMEVEE